MLEQATYPRLLGRAITHDVAFPFRMGAGFAGDVTRSHPSATIEPNRQSAAAPVLGFGLGVLFDPAAAGVRQIVIGDIAVVDIYGISVRFYPGQGAPPTGQYGQEPLGTATLGGPPTNQPIDILRQGYILVKVVGACRKGDPVFLWAAPSGGGHVQGSFEIAASAGNTIALGSSKTTFNSGPDANGIAEVAFNI